MQRQIIFQSDFYFDSTFFIIYLIVWLS